MQYEQVQHLGSPEFKRLTGVDKDTFATMLSVLETAKSKYGRPPKLCLPDQLLLALCYWREYRTQFHAGLEVGLSESNVCRTIKRIENLLIQDERFHLPGKKSLRPGPDGGTAFEIVLVDVTECPIERPKKKSESTTRAKSASTHKRVR